MSLEHRCTEIRLLENIMHILCKNMFHTGSVIHFKSHPLRETCGKSVGREGTHNYMQVYTCINNGFEIYNLNI